MGHGSTGRSPRPPRHRPSVSTPGTMAVAVGSLFVVAGGLGDATVLAYRPQAALALAVIATTGVVGGAALVALAKRVPLWLLRAIPVTGAAMITVVVVLAGPGPLGWAYTALYVFVVVDASLFFRWRFATAHWALGAVLHVGTTLATFQPLVQVAVVQVCFAAVGMLTGWLVRRASAVTVDPVTGLQDRRGFDRLIERAVNQAAGDSRFTVVLLDLDGFGAFNRRHGPERGDQVLLDAAEALTAVVGVQGTVCRFGSDEFAVLAPGADPDAEQLVDLMRAAVAPLTFAAAVTQLTRGDSRATISRRLVNALHQAAQSGRTVMAEESDRTSARLREAIVDGELSVHYQPIIGLDGRQVVGAEALVRWIRPQESIPPDVFVRQAERDGTILELGRWVMATACADAAAWPSGRTVSVNVSHVELCQPGYAAGVLRQCRAAGLAAESLVVELTETTLGLEDALVAANLQVLRDAGVGVSIDDFGTGYSSLARLHELPVTQLKIDRAFVAALDEAHGPGPVIEAIVALARALELEVVAEGVETGAQESALAQLGVPWAQGYRFARPAPVDELVFGAGVPAQGRRTPVDRPVERASQT